MSQIESVEKFCALPIGSKFYFVECGPDDEPLCVVHAEIRRFETIRIEWPAETGPGVIFTPLTRYRPRRMLVRKMIAPGGIFTSKKEAEAAFRARKKLYENTPELVERVKKGQEQRMAVFMRNMYGSEYGDYPD